jgi:type III restriction enzyme
VPLRKGADGKAVYLSTTSRRCGTASSTKTTYRVQFDNAKLLQRLHCRAEKAPAIAKARLQWRKADIAIGKAGVEATREGRRRHRGAGRGRHRAAGPADRPAGPHAADAPQHHHHPDRERRLDDFKRNPQQFIEQTAEIINRCKRLALVDGIKYQRLGDEHFYAQELFERTS